MSRLSSVTLTSTGMAVSCVAFLAAPALSVDFFDFPNDTPETGFGVFSYDTAAIDLSEPFQIIPFSTMSETPAFLQGLYGDVVLEESDILADSGVIFENGLFLGIAISLDPIFTGSDPTALGEFSKYSIGGFTAFGLDATTPSSQSASVEFSAPETVEGSLVTQAFRFSFEPFLQNRTSEETVLAQIPFVQMTVLDPGTTVPEPGTTGSLLLVGLAGWLSSQRGHMQKK